MFSPCPGDQVWEITEYATILYVSSEYVSMPRCEFKIFLARNIHSIFTWSPFH